MKAKPSNWTRLLAVAGLAVMYCASCSSTSDSGAAAAPATNASTSAGTRQLPHASGSAPGVGSHNVTIADPAVPRPDTKPCVVELIPRQEFGEKGTDSRMDAKPHPFKYQPPEKCKGPWAKVVLEANFSVDAGRQYDRTASIWLNGVNLYFGTTQEPSPGRGDRPRVAPSWQVQRDLTDYASLFRTPGNGKVWINNWLDETRASMLYASARLLFYPADASHPAPQVPDAVYALNGAKTAPANLQQASDALSKTIAFPKNTARVYMDVFAQPQHNDEFYYFCLDDSIIKSMAAALPKKFHACGGGSYREVLVSIDGQRAGLAPVSPWVFTGGIDHFMWRPTPSVQTLNFIPYRVDLTPFAGLLSDGAKHTVSVKVLNADHFFSIAAALLVYRDAKASHTGGGIVKNTLEGLSLKPALTRTLGWDGGKLRGGVTTRAAQQYVIEGYVNTPAGRVDTQVDGSIGFSNTQRYAVDATRTVKLAAHVDNVSRSTGAAQRERREKLDYALRVFTRGDRGGSGRRDRATQVRATFAKDAFQDRDALPFYESHMRNTIVAADQVSYDPANRSATVDFHDQSSAQNFSFTNSLGDCYTASVQARAGRVTHVSKGLGCSKPDSLHWFTRPDGSPDSYGWRKAGK